MAIKVKCKRDKSPKTDGYNLKLVSDVPSGLLLAVSGALMTPKLESLPTVAHIQRPPWY